MIGHCSGSVGSPGQGDMAVDDLVFSPECVLATSSSTPATTEPTGPTCDWGQVRQRRNNRIVYEQSVPIVNRLMFEVFVSYKVPLLAVRVW